MGDRSESAPVDSGQHNPNPSPGVSHDFDCTHDPCCCVEVCGPDGCERYVCDVAGCEQGFASMDAVVAHERTHRRETCPTSHPRGDVHGCEGASGPDGEGSRGTGGPAQPVGGVRRGRLRRLLDRLGLGTHRVEAEEGQVERLSAEVERLSLLLIESRNPGIDIEQVKAERATRSGRATQVPPLCPTCGDVHRGGDFAYRCKDPFHLTASGSEGAS